MQIFSGEEGIASARFASGMSIKEIVEDYPSIKEDDILAALAFAANREAIRPCTVKLIIKFSDPEQTILSQFLFAVPNRQYPNKFVVPLLILEG